MSNSTQSQEKESPVEDWSTQEEEILIRWSDKALCYRWLHEHSEKRFRKFNYALTIPVIILFSLGCSLIYCITLVSTLIV